jgi:hypothetical protein
MKDGRNKERRSEMNIEKIKEHYEHAKQKHPYFCDCMNPPYLTPEQIKFTIDDRLHIIRKRIERGYELGNTEWDEILNCEVWEIHEAYANGDTDAAIEECYDAIAVLLRVIDVLEGHQELGSPNKEKRGE